MNRWIGCRSSLALISTHHRNWPRGLLNDDRPGDFGEHGGVEGPAVAGGVGDDDVVVFVDADHGSRLAETFVHAVGPAAVAVLQVLDDLHLEVDVHVVADLEAVRAVTA